VRPSAFAVFRLHWTANNGAELAFDEVIRSGNTEAANMLRAIRSFLGENDMMTVLMLYSKAATSRHAAED
jgi:site-specific DNA-methyltransferase (adenine-specific)